MGWEKEDLYGECFDEVWAYDPPYEPGVMGVLNYKGNVAIFDEEKCKKEFFDLLTKWHDEGLIKPGGT